MSIAEKLVTIAENEQRVYEAGRLKTLRDSEYMNAKVSGTAIAVNDVSPIEHSVGCTLSSKNILNPYSYELKRGDVVVEDDGSIVFYGGMETGGEIIYTVNLVGTYALSFGDKTDFNGVTIYVDGNDCTEDFKNNATLGLTTTSVFREHTREIKLIQGSQTTSCLYIQLEKEIATEFTPYVSDFSDVKIRRFGKNLLNDRRKTYVTGNVFIGVNSSSSSFWLSAGTYTFWVELAIDILPSVYVYNQNGDTLAVKYGAKKVTFTLTESTYIRVKVYHGNITSVDDITCAQIELGEAATEYENYKQAKTLAAASDGTITGLEAVAPNMTLISNNDGVVINANYLRDIDTYIDNLKTNVALTGGE